MTLPPLRLPPNFTIGNITYSLGKAARTYRFDFLLARFLVLGHSLLPERSPAVLTRLHVLVLRVGSRWAACAPRLRAVGIISVLVGLVVKTSRGIGGKRDTIVNRKDKQDDFEIVAVDMIVNRVTQGRTIAPF